LVRVPLKRYFPGGASRKVLEDRYTCPEETRSSEGTVRKKKRGKREKKKKRKRVVLGGNQNSLGNRPKRNVKDLTYRKSGGPWGPQITREVIIKTQWYPRKPKKKRTKTSKKRIGSVCLKQKKSCGAKKKRL